VTHDQEEAMTLGDRVAVLNNGVLEQVGTPDDLYRNPASLFVATFIGSPPMNIVDGVVGEEALSFGNVQVPLASLGRLPSTGTRVTVGIRPTDLSLNPLAELPVIQAVVDTTENLGAEVRVLFSAHGSTPVDGFFTACLDAGTRLGAGEPIRLAFSPDRLYLFDVETGRALTQL
jgi:multiple sugar transport system ATP-binding protein